MSCRPRQGGDLYPILIAANRKTIDWFLVSNVERGLTRDRMTCERVFAARYAGHVRTSHNKSYKLLT